MTHLDTWYMYTRIQNCMTMSIFIGLTETYKDKMRSILAQYEYHKMILDWEKQGVPFRYHIYVPETNEVTKEPFHDREDEGHMLKVFHMIRYISQFILVSIENGRES